MLFCRPFQVDLEGMAFSIDPDTPDFKHMEEDEFGTPKGSHSAPSPVLLDRFQSLDNMRDSHEECYDDDDEELDMSLDDMLDEVR